MNLEDRIDRLESLEEIRQLPAKYALALDMRDWDAVVNLFVEDVRVPGRQRGRPAFKAWLDATFRDGVLGSSHVPGAHVIEFAGHDSATGVVYSRNDLETASDWMLEVITYQDTYERREDRWWFVRRLPLFFYQCDLRDPPLGEHKRRFPGREPMPETFHDGYPSWADYLSDAEGYAQRPVAPPPEPGHFLRSLRRGAPEGEFRSTPRRLR